METSKKKNRWLEALSGRGTPMEVPEYPEVPLNEMVQKLEQMPEAVWGRYAFAREPLERKFTEEQKCRYIRKANVCGREWANRIAGQYGTRSPRLLAQKMGLQVKTPKVPTGGGVVLFAQYVQPDEITIFTDCVEKAAALGEKCGCALLEQEKLTDILLAHELFHAVEEQHEKEIYTRTEKIELWRKPFSNRSGIVCLSEIAAMAFAAELLELQVSPYMLDVLLVYSYDQNTAWGLFEEICSLQTDIADEKEKNYAYDKY